MLSSTSQSTAHPLLSTLYKPLSKHLISVLVQQPEWQAMRTQILAALSAFPEARLQVAEVLEDGTRNGTRP